MKYYLAIAQEYFKHLEGVHLYPTLKDLISWVWIIATAFWLWMLIRYFHVNQPSHQLGTFFSIILPEVLWLFATSLVSNHKNKKLIESTNLRLSTAYKTASECRYQMLRSLVKVPTTEFLKITKEIDDLITLEQKFKSRSSVSFTDLLSNIYDRESKARLLALTIALFSIVLALVAKSDVTIDSLFEVYSSPGAIKLLIFVAILVGLGFFVLIGLRIMLFTIIEALASWRLKLVGSSTISSRWLLSYLIRDLVIYHSSVEAITQSMPAQEVKPVDATKVAMAKLVPIPSETMLFGAMVNSVKEEHDIVSQLDNDWHANS